MSTVYFIHYPFELLLVVEVYVMLLWLCCGRDWYHYAVGLDLLRM